MRKDCQVIEVALTTAAAAYADGDVIGVIKEVPSATRDGDGASTLLSVTLLDKAAQSAAIDLFFFREAPASSIGADNAAFAVADADLSKVLGVVSLASANYKTSSNNSAITVGDIHLMLSGVEDSKSVYVVAVSRGTPTYASTTDLTLKLGLERH